jgi:hypothetical protein
LASLLFFSGQVANKMAKNPKKKKRKKKGKKCPLQKLLKSLSM